MGSPTRSNNSNTPFREMKLIALFAFAAIAVAHSAPEDSAVAENFVQSTPEFVVESQDDYNMSAENLLAELNGKSWKSLEAEFNQLIQNEDSDTQMATLFSFQKMAKMDPEELGQLTMDAMHKDQSAELEQMYAAPKAKSEESGMVATDAKMESRTGWHRWRPHAHIPHRWRPVRQITRAVRHVARYAASAARAVGGVIVSAVKRLGAYLKSLAAKLCRKVLRTVVKKVHKYVKRHVTRFCIKLCIKAAGKVYLLGGGPPAAGAVAATIGAGCKIGCKLAFKALVKFIRHRYLSGAKMDVFVADYVCDSVGLKSEELVAIEDHSDEQWGFIKKHIKKRIKNFVKKSKKRISRSKIHQYYKRYKSKYLRSRKKLKSWLAKRKRRRL